MKKLFIIITLFMSSFFLFNFKAKAYEFNVDLDISLINDDFYNFKDKADIFIKNDTTYSDNYFIYISGSTLYGVILPDNGYKPSCTCYSSSITCWFNSSSSNTSRLILDSNGNVVVNGTASNRKDIYTTSSNRYSPIIYSNFDFLMNKDAYISSINYKFGDFTLSNFFDSESNLYTLYDIYKEYENFIGNKDLIHKEEIDALSNFYTLCMEKLSYLANVIVDNYIYLSIIVIFLLIFVFKLIFRRYL